MRRWMVHAAQYVSVLWATLFLTVCLLHPLTHDPLQAHGSDCLVCVLQKTPAPEPIALQRLLSALKSLWGDAQLLLTPYRYPCSSASVPQPRIPRAPPA
ncbi:MAG: hypothetical protein ACK4ME_03650 [Fimbriimonadales bacterium]